VGYFEGHQVKDKEQKRSRPQLQISENLVPLAELTKFEFKEHTTHKQTQQIPFLQMEKKFG